MTTFLSALKQQLSFRITFLPATVMNVCRQRIEEASHHSVVLMRTDGEPAAECVGMRVASEEDIHRAVEYLPKVGGTAQIVERRTRDFLLSLRLLLARRRSKSVPAWPSFRTC